MQDGVDGDDGGDGGEEYLRLHIWLDSGSSDNGDHCKQ